VRVCELPARFPFPDAEALAAAARLFATLPDGALVLVDDLAGGVLGHELARHAPRLRLVALVHHPLYQETGLDEAQQRHFFTAEQGALRHVRRVVVTSAATAAAMRASGLVAELPAVVVPGTEPVPLREPSESPFTRLVCVATLTPRKRHALLIDTLASLRDLPWHLACIGGLDLHPPTTAAVRAQLERLALTDRVELRGECSPSQLQAILHASDLFVLPSAFEGYGMAVAEALAQGVPVIATRTGAAAELVGDAGLLVEPDDASGLERALRSLLADPREREARATAARRRAATLPRWPDSARQLAVELAAVAAS
jgi:glycosyltransferase involved in cell wall biosynthesis